MSSSSSSQKRTARPKRRVKQHVHGECGVTLVRSVLPQHWVVREISPDYGLDLHIETFLKVPKNEAVWDALGEHVFAQVKTADGVRFADILPHRSVESKPPELLPAEREEDMTHIKVVSYSLETDEIETVRQMGAAVPVLLLVVDKKTATTYYICLNDWITKVLPRVCPDWRDQRTVTVHIPAANVLSADGGGWNYLTLLAKRPKLYGAFPEFAKQQEELRYAADRVHIFREFNYEKIPDLSVEIGAYKQLFLFYYAELVDLDIWPREDGSGLGILDHLAEELEEVRIAVEEIPEDWGASDDREGFYGITCEAIGKVEMYYISLTGFPRNYGLLTRNWNLPTQIGAHVRAINEGQPGSTPVE